MSELHFKGSCRFTDLQPEMVIALLIVMQHCRKIEVDCWITSANDSKHKKNSLHYSGKALDFRSKHIHAARKKKWADGIRANLGPAFDVVLESDHLHVEYDPK